MREGVRDPSDVLHGRRRRQVVVGEGAAGGVGRAEALGLDVDLDAKAGLLDARQAEAAEFERPVQERGGGN